MTHCRECRAIGPPGTGKTSFLSKVLHYEAQQYGSDNVIACSLTRTAAQELASRRLPLPRENIGTLHSLAYRALDRPDLMETPDGVADFNTTVPHAMRLSGGRHASNLDTVPTDIRRSEGDRLHADYMTLRARMAPRDVWPSPIRAFAREWENYKRNVAAVDFTDMLEMALADVDWLPGRPSVIVADEVQDFGKLGMELLWKWGAHAEELVTAGDPDQCLYSWAGADPQVFRDRPAEKVKLLEQSFRVPRAVHAYAMGIIQRNTDRDDINYYPRDTDGVVRRLSATFEMPQQILLELDTHIGDGRTVMVLATCSYMLRDVISCLRQRGIAYHNPYRPAEGAWNPLCPRENAVNAAERLMMYRRPFHEGERTYWTEEELRLWMEMTKGLRRRGVQPPVSDEPDTEVPIQFLMEELLKPEYHHSILNGDLAALRAALAKQWEKSAGYAIDIAQKHGDGALRAEPKVVIGTIHSVKGGEADVVYVFPDVSYSAYKQYVTDERARNELRRVFYVGATRAREELVLCAPATNTAFGWGLS